MRRIFALIGVLCAVPAVEIVRGNHETVTVWTQQTREALEFQRGRPGAAVPPPSASSYVPDPLLPNFDLTEDKAAKEAMRYCNAIYNPPFPLLSNEQNTFAYEHRGDIDGDVRTCASWFDPKRIAADRKIAMRYCLINHDLRATGGKAAYDACMNQHDVLTALCTQEYKNRTELNQKKGFGSDPRSVTCPGVVPNQSEYLVATRGGNQDMGRFVVPTAGPDLPAMLRAPLPKGLLASGKRLDETVAATASSPGGPPPAGTHPVAGKACRFLTRTDAESILGGNVDGRGDTDTDCGFVEVGFNGQPQKNKQIQLSLKRSASADANAANVTRNVLAGESERMTMNVRELTDFADAAIWSWRPAPMALGTLYAFKGGTASVVVAIGGLDENAALQSAKKVAAGPLEGAGRSTYAYAAPAAAPSGMQSPAAYDPAWRGRTIAMRGTVARLGMTTDGSPRWLTIYFKESPDASFVVCSPSPDMFQDTVGDLYRLVGKTIEVSGRVETSMCAGKGASIRVVDSKSYRVVNLRAQTPARPPAVDLATRTSARNAARLGLDICNTGQAEFDAFVSKQGRAAMTHIAPAQCAHVYEDRGGQAYVGFALADSRGQWGAARRVDLLAGPLPPVWANATEKVSVRHGNGEVSVPVQMLFRPPAPTCTQSYSTPPPTPGTLRPQPVLTITCESIDYALNAVAYPNTREVTFYKKCYDCPQDPAAGAQDRANVQQGVRMMSGISASAGGLFGGIVGQALDKALLESLEGPPEFPLMTWDELKGVPKSGAGIPSHLTVRGTVSSVDVRPLPDTPPSSLDSLLGTVKALGLPGPFVNVYFRESPGRSTASGISGSVFNVCTYGSDVLEEMFGADFRSRMVGQTFEIQGEFGHRCLGSESSIAITMAHQIQKVAGQNPRGAQK